MMAILISIVEGVIAVAAVLSACYLYACDRRHRLLIDDARYASADSIDKAWLSSIMIACDKSCVSECIVKQLLSRTDLDSKTRTSLSSYSLSTAEYSKPWFSADTKRLIIIACACMFICITSSLAGGLDTLALMSLLLIAAIIDIEFRTVPRSLSIVVFLASWERFAITANVIALLIAVIAVFALLVMIRFIIKLVMHVACIGYGDIMLITALICPMWFSGDVLVYVYALCGLMCVHAVSMIIRHSLGTESAMAPVICLATLIVVLLPVTGLREVIIHGLAL